MKKTILYIVLFICFQNISHPLNAQSQEIDSILKLIKTDKEDTVKTIHLISIGIEYTRHGDYSKGLEYGKSGLALAKKLNFTKCIASAHNNIGLIYSDQGNYPKALESYFSSLKVFETMKNTKGVTKCYNNIGVVYFRQGNYDDALKNHFAALKLREEMKDTKGIGSSKTNIGNIYVNQKKYEDALKMYTEALELYRELKDDDGIGMSYNNIGIICDYKNDYTEALKNYYAALKINEQEGDIDGLAISHINLGQIHLKLGKVKEAETYLTKALAFSKEVGDKEWMMQSYGGLASIDSIRGNYKSAFDNYKLYAIYRDSMNNEESKQKSMQITMQYEFDKKEAATEFKHNEEIVLLEAENKLHSQQRLFLILFIIVALVLLFFAKRAYDNKKKIAEFMASENNRKEVLLQEVHHRINNNLQIISSLLTLQANSADDEKLTAYLKQSQNRIQSLSVLHELLYQSDSPLQINMNDYLNKVLDFHRDVLTTLKAKVEISMQVTNAIFPTKMAVPLALIVNELATNSIKYAFNDAENGKIVVSLEQIENKEWLLKVSDTGMGLPEDTNFRKDSLGLRLVTIMTKQIKGTLTKYNKNGATFELRFIA